MILSSAGKKKVDFFLEVLFWKSPNLKIIFGIFFFFFLGLWLLRLVKIKKAALQNLKIHNVSPLYNSNILNIIWCLATSNCSSRSIYYHPKC